MKRSSRQLMETISAASAAIVWNCLPEIAKLPRDEGFERLEDCFRTAFITYLDGLGNWGLPEPSDN